VDLVYFLYRDLCLSGSRGNQMSGVSHPVFASSNGLLDAIVSIKAEQKSLSSRLESLLDELDRRVAAGQIDPGGFSHNDWAFSYSEGKRSWAYPAPVKTLEQQLKAAKKVAEADGSATASTDAPFWTIKGPQS
jgi:hypothetical protein